MPHRRRSLGSGRGIRHGRGSKMSDKGLTSYPDVYALGHRMTVDILQHAVTVEEKVDGSQFSFGLNSGGELMCRSKGAQIFPEAPEKMFTKAVETAKALAPHLQPGWTYRAEYLQKPKHNTLCYGRVPKQHLILFDVNTGLETYAPPFVRQQIADSLGLECVPLIFQGRVDGGLDQLKEWLNRDSLLGGVKIEGVVLKPVGMNLFGPDKKAIVAKYVSEAFKEIHGREWKAANPSSKDIITDIVLHYKTPARWEKAVQHLRDAGTLEGSPRDIGKLMTEVPKDIEKECVDAIKDALWRYAWPKIRRGTVAGLPEWYKERLASEVLEVKE